MRRWGVIGGLGGLPVGVKMIDRGRRGTTQFATTNVLAKIDGKLTGGKLTGGKLT